MRFRHALADFGTADRGRYHLVEQLSTTLHTQSIVTTLRHVKRVAAGNLRVTSQSQEIVEGMLDADYLDAEFGDLKCSGGNLASSDARLGTAILNVAIPVTVPLP
jgi:hypothetical protein